MAVDAREAIRSIPDQLLNPVHARAVQPHSARSVLICGMGGSGASGDAIAAAHTLGYGPPVHVWKRDAIPSWVDESVLVLAVSFSGSTAETVHAAASATERGARVVTVTSGGELAGLGLDNIMIEPTGLPPRFSVGSLMVGCVTGLQAASMTGLDPDWGGRVHDELTRVSKVDAAALASAAHNKRVHVFSASAVGEAAARRWRSDFAENSKVSVIDHPLPEMNHNDIVALASEDSESVGFVLLTGHEDATDLARLKAAMAQCSIGSTIEVAVVADDPVTGWLALTMLGGAVTVELAHLRGVDPVAIDPIDSLKKAMQQ